MKSVKKHLSSPPLNVICEIRGPVICPHMWLRQIKLSLFDLVFAQGGRRRRRQPGRREQPTRHHLHRLQDVSEHRGQRQGRTQAGTCDELMAHSCLSPTGFPGPLLWGRAGAAGGSCCRETQAGVVGVFSGA